MIATEHRQYVLFDHCPHCRSHYRSMLQADRCASCRELWRESPVDWRIVLIILATVIGWLLALGNAGLHGGRW